MKIRNATKKDLRNILKLLKEMEKKMKNGLGDGNLISIAQMYIGKKNKCFFIAEEENKIIGYLFGHIEKKFKEDKKFSWAKLVEIYVNKTWRKRGISKKLLKTFYNWSKHKGASKVRLDVETKNKFAFSFWKKQNYKEETKCMERII